MKSGILYSAKNPSKQGQLDVSALVKKLKAIAFSLRHSGSLFILLAFLGFGWIYIPLGYYQVKYQVLQIFNIKHSISRFTKASKPNWDVPDMKYSIYIPKIEAISRVIDNVSIVDKVEYQQALIQGVAAASGMAKPGQKGTVYLFAHSTDSPLNFARYNAVFYLLDKMKIGDSVEIVYANNLYRYRVYDTQILKADDVRYLQPQKDEERLVLQTCWPPGTAWKRFVVVAKRIT